MAAAVVVILKLFASMMRTSPLLLLLVGGNCMVRNAKSMGEGPSAPAATRRSSSSGPGTSAWKMKRSFLGFLADAEIFGDDVGRRVRHPVGQEHGFVFREIAIVEDQQEFAAVGSESLNGMGNARREKPEFVFFHVGDEAFAVRIDAGDAGGAVKHERPFRRGVPMQLANASGGEAHILSIV